MSVMVSIGKMGRIICRGPRHCQERPFRSSFSTFTEAECPSGFSPDGREGKPTGLFPTRNESESEQIAKARSSHGGFSPCTAQGGIMLVNRQLRSYDRHPSVGNVPRPKSNFRS